MFAESDFFALLRIARKISNRIFCFLTECQAFFCSFQNRQKKFEPNFLKIGKCLERPGELLADPWRLVRQFMAAKVKVGFCAFFRSFRISAEKVQPNFCFDQILLMNLLLTLVWLKWLVSSASVAGTVSGS